MKILVSGSHGLVGKALSKALTKDGHEIINLVRRDRVYGKPEIEWHPNKGLLDPDQIEGFDAVVHLAGESIASGRWTDEKKRRIRESRVQGTTLLSQALAGLSRPPKRFISASAIGYYGSRGDEVLTEDSRAGSDFLSDVCAEWEKATERAAEKGISTCTARFGIILDKEGGALEKMLTPFRLGLGGKIGDGKQWMSWIGLEDVVSALVFLLESGSISGPVNIVAPNPVTNAEFTKTLGKVLSRPTFLSVPAFAARLAFGEMADGLLLSSAKVEPKKLKEAGFKYRFPNLEASLTSVLKD